MKVVHQKKAPREREIELLIKCMLDEENGWKCEIIKDMSAIDKDVDKALEKVPADGSNQVEEKEGTDGQTTEDCQNDKESTN